LKEAHLPIDQVKDEIKKYMQAIETNYNDAIRVLKEKNEKLAK